MRWIENEKEYRALRDVMRECMNIDSDRQPTDLLRLRFGDVEMINRNAMSFLRRLMGLAGERACYYMVSDPDPEYFWKDRLGRYAVFEVVHDDPAEEYIRSLNEPFVAPGRDAMASTWYSYAIFSGTLRWFAYATRSDRDDTGHLWISPEWADQLLESESWLFI